MISVSLKNCIYGVWRPWIFIFLFKTTNQVLKITALKYFVIKEWQLSPTSSSVFLNDSLSWRTGIPKIVLFSHVFLATVFHGWVWIHVIFYDPVKLHFSLKGCIFFPISSKYLIWRQCWDEWRIQILQININAFNK